MMTPALQRAQKKYCDKMKDMRQQARISNSIEKNNGQITLTYSTKLFLDKLNPIQILMATYPLHIENEEDTLRRLRRESRQLVKAEYEQQVWSQVHQLFDVIKFFE
jgi:hypothetical protein